MSEPTAVRPLEPAALRQVVAVLCLTQIVAWGVLFYAFPVLAPTISAEQGWSLPGLVAIFTAAQVVAGVAGVWVGRRLDRRGPRTIMTVGSCLGVLGIVAVALAPGLPAYALAWVTVGIAMAATLYPPAFAALTHWAPVGVRVRALTAVTLVAGLASTVFAPLAAVLVDQVGWRRTYLVLALVLALCIPAHLWGLRHRWVAADGSGATDQASPAPRPPRLRTLTAEPGFLLLVAAFTLAGFAVYAVVINQVPLLLEGGLSTREAALALGIGGVGQVVGRLAYGRLLAPVPLRARTVGVLGAAALTTVAVGVATGSFALAAVASFAAGGVRGVFTLLQATAVSDRWGSQDYGARNGVLTGGVTLAAAVAPWVGAAVAAALGGYRTAFLLLALVAAGSALLVRPGDRRGLLAPTR